MSEISRKKRDKVERMKRMYPSETRVELISMDDFHAPPAGTRGTVQYVDNVGTIHVRWDTGSSLGLVYGEDVFIKVEEKRIKMFSRCDYTIILVPSGTLPYSAGYRYMAAYIDENNRTRYREFFKTIEEAEKWMEENRNELENHDEARAGG